MKEEEISFPIYSVIGIWFLFVLLAILNGTVRVALIVPLVGAYAGHIISSIIFISVIFAVTWFYIKKKDIVSKGLAFRIGLIWFVLTVAFEFLFGHFVMNHPWEMLIHDYNILEGRIWLLVLAATLLAPVICFLFIKTKTRPLHKENLDG